MSAWSAEPNRPSGHGLYEAIIPNHLADRRAVGLPIEGRPHGLPRSPAQHHALSLALLAALAPADWEMGSLTSSSSRFDFEARANVVAIATRTLTSFRAYDIADEFHGRVCR